MPANPGDPAGRDTGRYPDSPRTRDRGYRTDGLGADLQVQEEEHDRLTMNHEHGCYRGYPGEPLSKVCQGSLFSVVAGTRSCSGAGG